MHWQDFALASGNIVFAIGLLWSIFTPNKPHAVTSLITTIWLTLFTVSYATLGLTFAAIGAASNVLLWVVLFVQVVRRNLRERPLVRAGGGFGP
jgi:hypothetical protein